MKKKNFGKKIGKKVCTKTIRKNLHQLGIFSRVAAVKPFVTDKQRENRLRWSIRKWNNIIWSDESRFKIFGNDGPIRVWRRAGERYNIENIAPSVKHGGGGIMVWGCFSGKGMGPLVRVDGRMNHQDYIRILDAFNST